MTKSEQKNIEKLTRDCKKIANDFLENIVLCKDGDCSGLRGDCSKLDGDCSGLYGDYTELNLKKKQKNRLFRKFIKFLFIIVKIDKFLFKLKKKFTLLMKKR